MAGKQTIDYKNVRELYDQGRRDGEIARELGCNLKTIYKWRKKESLPSNNITAGKAGYESSQIDDPESILSSPTCIDYFLKGKKHG